jgi:RNA polymerase sigma factor (sigma-70 family)
VITPLPPVDVERFHAGDERLFAELVRMYSPRMLPHLRRYAQTTDADVNDLLQEVWLRAFQKRRGFDGRGSLFGWLLTICRTVGIATVRKSEPYVQLHDHLTSSTPDASAEAERRIDRARLHEAVDQLPLRQRDVVMLRIVEDRSTAEAARALGCAEGTIKAALHAAIRRLKEQLSEKVR